MSDTTKKDQNKASIEDVQTDVQTVKDGPAFKSAKPKSDGSKSDNKTLKKNKELITRLLTDRLCGDIAVAPLEIVDAFFEEDLFNIDPQDTLTLGVSLKTLLESYDFSENPQSLAWIGLIVTYVKIIGTKLAERRRIKKQNSVASKVDN